MKDPKLKMLFKKAVENPAMRKLFDIATSTNSDKIIADAEIVEPEDIADARLVWYAALNSLAPVDGVRSGSSAIIAALNTARIGMSVGNAMSMLIMAADVLKDALEPRDFALLMRCVEVSPIIAVKPPLSGLSDKEVESALATMEKLAEELLKDAPATETPKTEIEEDATSREARIIDIATKKAPRN